MLLRPATMDDAALLYAWRTDPLTRAASHQTSTIDFASHLAWLKRSLALLSRRIIIAEADGVPVGTMRTDIEDGITVLSWTVAPEHRGRGIGRTMVQRLVSTLPGILRAEVKCSNTASLRIAERAGFMAISEVDGMVYLERPITY